MTCESVEDDCSIDTCMEAWMPCIENVTSLSYGGDNNEHSSNPILPADVFPSAAKRPLSPSMSQSLLKRKKTNMDCCVLLKRLPEMLVQAAPMCKIFVSGCFNIPFSFLKSSEIDKTAATQTFQLQDHTVKTEPDELSPVVDDEQASIPHLATQQHSLILNSSVNMALASHLFNNGKPFYPHHDHSYMRDPVRKTSVATVTDATPANAAVRHQATSISLHTNSASIKSDGVERDVSVILLNCAKPPNTSASDATDSAVTEPHDVSRLVLSMLQQQNINLLPVRNNDSINSVIQNKNEEQVQMHSGSSSDVDDVVKLRKMLQISNKAKAALVMKLKAEQTKVRYLLAEVTSLKDTVKQLSNNHTNT